MGHSLSIVRLDRALALGATLVCAMALSGCGGVEFQGKVFDYLGVSGDQQQGDVRMAERPPLLVPPNLKTLPPPGSGTAVATARPDWPEDPERAQKRIASDEQAAKSKKEAEEEPFNAYAGKPTLLDKLFGRSRNDAEPIEDVPEPDPSDKRPQDKGDAVASSSPQPLTPHQEQAPMPASALQPAAPDSYNNMSNPTEGNAQPLY